MELLKKTETVLYQTEEHRLGGGRSLAYFLNAVLPKGRGAYNALLLSTANDEGAVYLGININEDGKITFVVERADGDLESLVEVADCLNGLAETRFKYRLLKVIDANEVVDAGSLRRDCDAIMRVYRSEFRREFILEKYFSGKFLRPLNGYLAGLQGETPKENGCNEKKPFPLKESVYFPAMNPPADRCP